MRFHELPPQVNSRFHYLTNGIIWSGAGLNMMIIAVNWYIELSGWQDVLIGLISFAFGVFVANTRFKKIVGKFNFNIRNLPDRSWFFSFQALRHYFLLGFMMALGITLRDYSGLDTIYLAIIYMIMGTTLFLSSFFFYDQLLAKEKQAPSSSDSTS